jgi:hypothetical protein
MMPAEHSGNNRAFPACVTNLPRAIIAMIHHHRAGGVRPSSGLAGDNYAARRASAGARMIQINAAARTPIKDGALHRPKTGFQH